MPLLRWSAGPLGSEKSNRGDVFDAPAEWVIAQGRLFLCTLALMALYLEPPHPPHFASATYMMLTGYCVYAFGLVVATNWRLPDPSSQRGIHIGDVIATSLLLFLTEGPTSPFLAFFTFILLAATLRWNWRGVIATFAILVVALVAASFGAETSTPAPSNEGEFTRTAIRIAYLGVMAGMLGYVSAYRERSRQRLASLAEWPAYVSDGNSPPFASTLAHAANVLGSPRVLVVWEEAEEPFLKIASWQQGTYQEVTEAPDSFVELVPPELTTLTFATENAASQVALLRTGHTRFGAPLIDRALIERFTVVGMASAPFAGTICRGRLFILDRTDFSEDHLLLTEIIASRVAIELDRQSLQLQAEHAAAMRERIVLARDLHDGVLQSLTAVGLQLKATSEQLNDENRARLEKVKTLLAHEQRRIREFVEAMRPHTSLSGETILSQNLRQTLKQVARTWDCALSFSIQPEDAAVSASLARQVSLMLSEAIANAVRHGKASNVKIGVSQSDHTLDIAVRDDGHGFGNPTLEISPQNGPASLGGRIAALGGSLEVLNSSTGVKLRIQLPITEHNTSRQRPGGRSSQAPR